MLDWTNPASIVGELSDAEEYRNRFTVGPRELRRWFHGTAYKTDHGLTNSMPEAAVHAYAAMLLPRIVHDNPRVRVASAMPVTQRLLVPAMQAALNRWCQMVDLRTTNERFAMDMILGWGVSYITNVPVDSMRPWDGDGPYLPRDYRISPDFFIVDPQCDHIEEARYMGHVWFCDKDDLVKRASHDPTYDKAAVEAVGTSDAIRFDHRSDKPQRDRRQVAIYDVWVPEIHQQETEEWDKAKGDAKVNGTLYTIARWGDGANFIRKPRPYYGPRSGPYTVMGAYSVPECPWPLSPLVAVQQQIVTANVTAVAQEQAIRKYRRFVVGDAKQMTDVNGSPMEDMFEGTAQTTGTFEIGGMTPQHVAAAQATFERLDRALGMSDAMRGNITGDGTATEAAIAQGAANARMAHVIRNFTEATAKRLRKVAWYLYHDKRVKMNLPQIKEAGLGEAVFTGGVNEGSFEALDIQIEPYSMERTTEALMQKRTQDAIQVALMVAQAAAANPVIGVEGGKTILQQYGAAVNLPFLADLIRNPQGGQNAAV